MSKEHLGIFIDKAKQIEVPDCPDSVEQNVLRRIRLSNFESEQSVWYWLFRLLQQPGFIAAGLAMIAVVSSGIAILSTQSNATEQDRYLLAADALDFKVFQQTKLFNFNKH